MKSLGKRKANTWRLPWDLQAVIETIAAEQQRPMNTVVTNLLLAAPEVQAHIEKLRILRGEGRSN